MQRQEAKSVIEALIFASEGPLPIKTIQKILHPYPYIDIINILREMETEYTAPEKGLKLVSVGGGYQFTTQPRLASWVKKLFRDKESRSLSAAALETLAIVAYKQPVTRAEIVAVRGVDVSGILHSLLEKSLIQIVGRREGPGRPLIYGTTRDFLLHFGLNDIKGLPKLEEIGEQQESPE